VYIKDLRKQIKGINGFWKVTVNDIDVSPLDIKIENPAAAEFDDRVNVMFDYEFYKKNKHQSDGHVYFIQDTIQGFVKIGWAKDPWERMRTLQTGNANVLRLVAYIPGTIETERAIQGFFKRHRGEWYVFDEDAEEQLRLILANVLLYYESTCAFGTEYTARILRSSREKVAALKGLKVSRGGFFMVREGEDSPSWEETTEYVNNHVSGNAVVGEEA